MSLRNSSAKSTADLLERPRKETLKLLELIVGGLPNREVRQFDEKGHQLEEIILDAEIDGDRYLLLRIPKFHAAPVVVSPRELEIVRMVAQGHPNKVIANILNISSWTVCTHLRRVFSKFGVSSRAAMIARVLANGLLFDLVSSTALVNTPAFSVQKPRKPSTEPATRAKAFLARIA